MASWSDNIPVPIDANGCVVPLDTKELVYSGETREVYGFFYIIRSKGWFVEFGQYEYIRHIRLGDCTLPDSWERLEEDAAKDPCAYFGYGDGSIYNKCQSCPAYGDDCCPAMAQDIIRRAKAIAVRDAND